MPWLTDNGFLNFLIITGFIIALVELLTIIHEFGHYAIAKWNKVRVAEFSIGFGPVMFQWGKKETKWSIRWIPFGGYVAVLSQEALDLINDVKKKTLTPDELTKVKKQLKPFDIEQDYTNAKVLEKVSAPKKVAFALMGVTFNFIVMFSLIWIGVSTIGVPTETQKIWIPSTYNPQTGEMSIISVDSIQIDTDFKDNDGNGKKDFDAEVEIDGQTGWQEMVDVFSNFNSEYLTVNDALPNTNVVIRFETYYSAEGKEHLPNEVAYMEYVQVRSQYNSEIQSINGWVNRPDYIGSSESDYMENSTTLKYQIQAFELFSPTESGQYVYFLTTPQFYQNGDADGDGDIDYGSWMIQSYSYIVPANSFAEAWNQSFVAMGNAFLLMFTFGAVQIDQYNEENNFYIHVDDFTLGWIVFMWYFIMMSALLIIFNLFPMPPLDGWKAGQWTWEGISKKKMNSELEAKLNKIGWSVIMLYSLLMLILPFILI